MAGPDILMERGVSLDFIDEISSIPGGEEIVKCIQCGTCSGCCPASFMMDYTPRHLVAMIRAGLREEVLSSHAIWLCTSCYTCTYRCPMGIKITDIMYALKRIALRAGKYPRGLKVEKLSKEFVNMINRYGRNHEAELVFRFAMKNPFKSIKDIPLGWSLFSHGKLPLMPEKVKNVNQIKTMIQKVEEVGGL